MKLSCLAALGLVALTAASALPVVGALAAPDAPPYVTDAVADPARPAADRADDHAKSIFDPAIRGHTDQYALKFVKPKAVSGS